MGSDRGKRLIFVGGTPRSGTTMIQNILDSHPDILGGPEFDRIPNIVDLRRKLQRSVEDKRIDYFCSKKDIDEAIGVFVERLLLSVADKSGRKYLSEKTPWNILVFDDLMDVFPSARFIYVVRDPRAVIASMIQVAKKAKDVGKTPPDYTENMWLAIKYIETCEKAAQTAYKKDPGRIMTVIYEEMVYDPEKGTRKICNFLGLDWDIEMIRPGERRHPGEEKMDIIFYDKKKYNRNPEANEVNKWKQLLSLREQVFISLLFIENREFVAYGYDFSVGKYSPLKRFLGSIEYKLFRKRYGYGTMPLRVLS